MNVGECTCEVQIGFLTTYKRQVHEMDLPLI